MAEVDLKAADNVQCTDVLEDKVKEIASYLNQCLRSDQASKNIKIKPYTEKSTSLSKPVVQGDIVDIKTPSKKTFEKTESNELITKVDNILPDSPFEQINGAKSKKRRRSSQEKLNNEENNVAVSNSKKSSYSLKCGICTKELSEVDWENHASEEHCYIAWKEGHKIDFTDDNLAKKLLKKLKESGRLKCTFCNLEIKSVKKFINHAHECIKIVYNCDSDISINNQTSNSEAVQSNLEFLHHDEIVRCGVCNGEVLTSLWMDHIAKEHNYQAWKSNDRPLDLTDRDNIRQHLHNITKQIGGLVCARCGLVRKYAKAFMQHVESCEGTADVGSNVSDHANETLENVNGISDASADDNNFIYTGVVKCGVCLKDVDGDQWLDHIHKEHNYLARVEGKTPLDLNNEEEVERHLLRIRSKIGHLACAKCGLKRKYLKTYLQHVQSCPGALAEGSNVSDQVNETCTSENINETLDTSGGADDGELIYTGVVKCGVCLKDVDGDQWLDHIHKEHNYLARVEGLPSLDPNNDEAIEKHLRQIRSVLGYLACAKCGLKRKFIKSFLQHVQSCRENSETTNSTNDSDLDGHGRAENNLNTTNLDVSNLPATVKCGVCDLEMEGSKWISHIHKEHKYIAWIHGSVPLDVLDEEQVWNHLNNLSKQIGGLVCAECGLSRKYVKAYLQHVKSCDGSTEESNVSLNCHDSLDETNLEESVVNYVGTVKCGVCGQEMDGGDWVDHIQKAHKYVAWVEGKKPLDLFCSKCGRNRKYVKAYLQHVKDCDGLTDQTNESIACENTSIIEEESEFIYEGVVKCGVCGEEVAGEEWIDHIHKQHNYIARVADRPPVNVKDEREVRMHLASLKKYVDALVCTNCGLAYRFVKSYIRHVKTCDGGVASESEGAFNDTCNSDRGGECISECSTFNYTGIVKCAVCEKQVDGADWLKHAQKAHDYLAWVEGKPPLDVNDEEIVRQHLYKITKQIGGLVCSKCGISRKYVKPYLQHIKSCDGNTVSEELLQSDAYDGLEDETPTVYTGTVKCGVCRNEVEGEQWIQHIQKKHNYLARIEGKPPLNLKDFKEVYRHLYAIAKQVGALICDGCGLGRSYVKSFLRHLQNCDLNKAIPSIHPELYEKLGDSLTIENVNDAAEVAGLYESEFVHIGIVECGVCNKQVDGGEWFDHIHKEHNYLARIKGREPLDLETKMDEVQMFLYTILKTHNGLVCKTCGVRRKYVKLFLQHIEKCIPINVGTLDDENLLQCAVCSEKVPQKEWRSHAMKNHYNIAWAIGMEPIDLKNPYAVEKYLKEYKQATKSLICKNCKMSRVSCAGFYAHIITCGKSDEETEYFKSFCTICNCKYLCIYKNQHLAMHREQEYVKERKLKVAEVILSKHEEENTQGRRKAAEKAKTVIENYKNKMNQCKHKCSSCGFGCDTQSELDKHACGSYSERLSDSEGSVAYDAQSDESESELDSDEEEEEERPDRRRKRHSEPALQIPRLPFKVNSARAYVAQAALDFFNTHYTSDVLFPNWRTSQYQEVPPEDLPNYLPPLDQSCKVKIANDEWITYNRFEAKTITVCSAFVGGCVRCVRWAPALGDDCVNYLCVCAHGAADAPRLPADHTFAHAALLQLWDFGDFAGIPKFALGIAHDFGTVWSMDWCPSGVRDCQPAGGGDTEARLGLLAIACSNGAAYVLVVPYPKTGESQEAQFIKIKPVIELRLCSGDERKQYQATAISWSQQKGHAIIFVGYADGSTAFYDLNCDSPLLKSVEDGVTILHPFEDERPHNGCVLDVGLFASDAGAGGGAWGASCSASCTGAHAALRAPAPRLHTQLATVRAPFTPHWPSILVTADDAIVTHSMNELEWQGGGRRLGAQRALATCARCGLGVVYSPPVLRVTRTHPAYRDPRRDMVGYLRMLPLSKKKRKHVNDELSMKVEPLTYDEAIKEYGIEFKLKTHMERADKRGLHGETTQNFPERFPLADVTAMAFCTSPTRHGKLAVASQAGLLFIVNI
ncbi:unnamed protein product, partial [Iphiclides podalirius]